MISLDTLHIYFYIWAFIIIFLAILFDFSKCKIKLIDYVY